MKIYVITYDLNREGQNYAQLYEELKKSPQWWHYLDSTWMIHTNENANDIYTRLAKHIDKNDHILVIEVGVDRQGWLPEKAWEWFREVQH